MCLLISRNLHRPRFVCGLSSGARLAVGPSWDRTLAGFSYLAPVLPVSVLVPPSLVNGQASRVEGFVGRASVAARAHSQFCRRHSFSPPGLGYRIHRRPQRQAQSCLAGESWPNPSVNRTTEKLRFSVPYGLRPPAAGYLER